MCAKPAASPPPNIVAFAAFYVIVGLAFALYLGRTLFAFPLLPFQLDDVNWCAAWLLTTVGDYYASSVCLCGVLVATDGPLRGGIWSALVLVLGSPWACAWTAIRLWTHRTLACASAAPSKRPHDDFGAGFVNAFVALYAITGLAFAGLLARTLLAHPLFPFQLDDLGWSAAWLLTTVGDYYASSVCLCGVIVATDGPLRGGVWALLVLVLGSPWACAWTAVRLWTHHTLALVGDGEDGSYQQID